jgi:hypothetical protein
MQTSLEIRYPLYRSGLRAAGLRRMPPPASRAATDLQCVNYTNTCRVDAMYS